MNSIKIQFDYDRIRKIEGKTVEVVHSGTFNRFQSVSDFMGFSLNKLKSFVFVKLVISS